MAKTILLIGAFDTKGEEYAFVRYLIEARGHRTVALNVGIMEEARHMRPDWDAAEVASKAGHTLEALRKKADRGFAMEIMSQGATSLVKELYEQKRFDGIVGMGGTGGTAVIGAAMRQLPIGFPKVLVSTAVSGETSHIAGSKDIIMIPSIVDVAGINRISRKIFSQAAGAISGLVEQELVELATDKPIIAITMFGNTTVCVERCAKQLTDKGYECLVFHCTGTGGKTMENLVDEGLITAVLDITTTEWADELCGGVFTAGPHRLEAPGKAGIAHLIVPGCVDMVNFGPADSVPNKYKDRSLYYWNPDVTLMRTNVFENVAIGKVFAEKANAAQGKNAFLIPLKGFSILGAEEQKFFSPQADEALRASLKEHLRSDIIIEEMNVNINDNAFADRAVEMLLELMEPYIPT